MKRILLTLWCLSIPFTAIAQDVKGGAGEEAHMHGPDGRHIAVASTFGPSTGQKSILSHHDLRVADSNDKAIIGCEVHSVIHRKGDQNAVIHREEDAYEPENEVYGSHMMYREPGEYEITETITFPDKSVEKVTFPVWVPVPKEDGLPHHHDSPSSKQSPLILYGIVLLAAGVAFVVGRTIGRRDTKALTIGLLILLVLRPVVGQDGAKSPDGEAHMHGPDGRHIAVASTFGTVQVPLKAYPTADFRDSAERIVGKYRLRLSIENEELAPPDPAVIPLTKANAETLGVVTENVTSAKGAPMLTAVGKVQPNPNRLVNITAKVSGRVIKVGLTPGDQVAAGSVVVMIESPELAQLQSDLGKAAAAVDSAAAMEARSNALVAEAASDLERFKASEVSARAVVDKADANRARLVQMAAAGAFAQPSLEAAQNARSAAEGELMQASAALALAEKSAQRLKTGLDAGVVARKDFEVAQLAVTQAKTRVSTLQLHLETAKQTLAREEKINRAGLRNAREVESAESDLAIAKAALNAASAEVTAAQKRQAAALSSKLEAATARAREAAVIAGLRARIEQLGAADIVGNVITIRTPIAGEVEARSVNAGEQVAAGAPLATILNTDDIWVESDVFEHDLSRIRVGQTVTVVADAVPDRTFTGRIAHIGGEVDASTRAIRVRTVLVNPGELLKPNMFVRVLVGSGTAGAALIPRTAVQEDGAEQVVFIRESEDSFRRVVVTIGQPLGSRVVILSGLKPGQNIVTTGSYQLLSLSQSRKGN
jgi:RND family efflux transporter MFP subunit